MPNFKFTEYAKKKRHCEFCDKRLDKYEAKICERHLREAVSTLLKYMNNHESIERSNKKRKGLLRIGLSK